jgi:hypothetical protein
VFCTLLSLLHFSVQIFPSAPSVCVPPIMWKIFATYRCWIKNYFIQDEKYIVEDYYCMTRPVRFLLFCSSQGQASRPPVSDFLQYQQVLCLQLQPPRTSSLLQPIWSSPCLSILTFFLPSKMGVPQYLQFIHVILTLYGFSFCSNLCLHLHCPRYVWLQYPFSSFFCCLFPGF